MEIKDIRTLLFRSGPAVRFVNLITLYRIITFPLLVILVLSGYVNVFKWLLMLSFITDAIDGLLARRRKATSVDGAKLDSIGDDLTVLSAFIGLLVTRFSFVREEIVIFFCMVRIVHHTADFLADTLWENEYVSHGSGKNRSRESAIFFYPSFLPTKINYPLFYTIYHYRIEILEEILLVAVLSDDRPNVKGLYWVLIKKADV